MSYIINVIRGFFMALADSVPGVSGGTIAFILGFYDKFINSLDGLVYGNGSKRKDAIIFLFKLGIGWIIGMLLAALVLTKLFESEIYVVSSVFIGFIIFSIPLIIKEEKTAIKGKYRNFIFTILGIILVCLITFLNSKISSEGVDITKLNIGVIIYVFIAAMCAISAMVLPGISGSTLLLIFGIYIPIMNSIRGLLKLDLGYLPVLIVFGLGVLTGVALFIKLVKLCLKRYRSATIYFILGLMIGSVYAIIMGPTTLEVPKKPLSFSTFSFIACLLGALFMFCLERLSIRLKDNKEEKDE